MTMKFTFAYNLDNHGWADATIQCDGNSYSIESISYLSDAFGNFSEAVLTILRGVKEAECAFDHEPGRTKIRFTRKGSDVRLRVYSFQQELVDEPWSKGKIEFDCVTTTRRLKSQYLEEADKMLSKHGIDGYSEKWRLAEFPIGTYERIKKCEQFDSANGESAAAPSP